MFSETIEPRWLSTMTAEYVDRMHARTVGLIPVIRKNAETFAVAGASVIGTRRLGDQLGALLAGVYSLFSSREIGLADARAWLQAQDWSEEAQLQEQKDEVACLAHLLQHVVAVQTDRGRHDRSLGELVRIFGQGIIDLHVGPEEAHSVLRRHGLRVDGASVLVAHSHSALARILRDTPWARNWRLILRRLPGAEGAGPTRFGSGAPERAVSIPLEVAL